MWACRNYREGLLSEDCEPSASLQRTVGERGVMNEHGRIEGMTEGGGFVPGEQAWCPGRHPEREERDLEAEALENGGGFNPNPSCACCWVTEMPQGKLARVRRARKPRTARGWDVIAGVSWATR